MPECCNEIRINKIDSHSPEDILPMRKRTRLPVHTTQSLIFKTVQRESLWGFDNKTLTAKTDLRVVHALDEAFKALRIQGSHGFAEVAKRRRVLQRIFLFVRSVPMEQRIMETQRNTQTSLDVSNRKKARSS